MDFIIKRYCLSILILICAVGANNTNTDGNTRVPRARGRVVKLYSGVRPDPIVCTNEGFRGDPKDCTIFYRCTKSERGKYTAFRFQCPPGTVYDPETEVCNHPQNTKRSECGGKEIISSHYEFNEIEELNELPSPISTKIPSYTTITAKPVINTVSSPIVQSSTIQTVSTTKHQEMVMHPGYSTTPSHSPFISPGISPVNIQQSTSGDICTSDGFMGDSVNCHKFYRCVGNQYSGFTKYEFSCSEPTIWDDDIKSCNHPWAVKRSRCGRNHFLGDAEGSTKSNPSPVRSTTDSAAMLNSNRTIQSQLQIAYGDRVHQTQTQIINSAAIQNQTQIFYGDRVNKTMNASNKQNQTQISHGSAVSQSQYQIGFGDGVVQTQVQIDHSKKTSQSQIQIVESTTIPTKPSSTQVQNPNKQQQNQNGTCSESGFMGDPYDCKKFYRCVDNGRGGFTRHEFSCGEGTSWDRSIEACNHAWAVKECGGKSTDTGSQETTIKSTTPSTTHSYSTTSKPTENILPSSEITQSSDVEDVGYNQVTISSMVPTPPTTTNVIHRIDNDCTSSGFIGDPTNCQIFYSCVENGNGGYTKHEFKCSEGTLWDSDIGGCNHAWAVKRCSGHVVPNIETTSLTTPKLTTTLTSAATHVVTTQNDDYDAGYGIHNEQSSLVTTIRTTKAPQDSSINLNNNCQSSGFMGDKDDCKKFYRCVSNGDGSYTRYEFMCGEGTVWDSKIESCNHAWAVDSCKNSSIALANEVTTQKGPVTNYEEIGDGYITPENKDPEFSTEKSTVSTTTSKTTHSLEQNKCNKNGFIGDLMDCKKFYRCVDNGDGSFIQYEFTCGDGTVWDQKIEACNHAWAVDKCGANYETDHVEATTSVSNVTVRDEEPVHAYPVAEYPIQKDEVTHETTQSTSITTSALPSSPCNKNGFIGDKRDCKIFYRCVNDGNGSFSKFEFKCGEGTVWDQSIEACNHAWAVKDCGAVDDTLNNKNESTTQAVFISSSEYYSDYSSPTSDINENDISDECKKEGFAGDTKDCKRFYRCVDNGQGEFTKYEFRCGEGTYWNEKIKACDHALSDNPCQENENSHVTKEPQHINDETQLDTTTKITTLLTTGSQENISITKKPQSSGAPCALEGFFGDQDDCQKFYRCVDDGSGRYTKYGFTCGDGTIWDQELLTCVHKSERSACSLHSTVTSSRPQETSHDNENSFISSTTHVPHKTSTVTDVPKQTSTENTTVAYQCTTEGFFANPTDCRKFIRCVSDGKGTFTKYDFACGDGTIWIQEILACDHDDGTAACHSQNEWTSRPQTNVESSTFSNVAISSTTAQNLYTNKTDDDYNTQVTKVPQVLKDDCQSEGFYGDKDDCQKYYRCVGNNNNGFSKYEFVCGEGTAWDSKLQTCNHNSGNNCRVSNQTENPTEFVVHDEISESTQSGSPSSTSASSTESTESTSNSSKDICEKAGFFGNTRDCTKFYRCVDYGEGGLTKYDFTCGDGTIWDQDLLTCNHPHDVVNPSCKLNQGETSENTTTSPETSSTSTSKTTESSKPNSTSSSTTTQSSQSTTTTRESSSNCTQVESSKNPGNKNVTCTKAGYYADPSDCKKFYRCVDWDGNGEKFSVYFFECGEGTIWDPALDTCNHEESVYPPRNCSNSQSTSSGQETTTTEESTTQETTTSEITTTQSTSSESTTQQSTTSEKTTTEQTTSSEQTTTQQTTTSEKTTTEQSTTSEPTTTQQSTTTDKTTTAQPTTTEQTTTQQPTSSETTTTEQSTTTSDGTTTQQVDSTTETTTQQATTTEAVTESTTTDKTTTQESTTISSTTTEESSTTDSTTEQLTTSEQTTTESGTSTTESNQQTSTTENQHETTTDHSPHSSSCPDTEDDQYLFVCPTSFKRHPKYCNLFYQCTEDDDTHEVKVAVFNCPNNTIYDESKVQCVEEDKADKKCDGEIAARRRVKRVGASHKEPIVVTKDSQKCVMEGHMSFEKNSECSPAFLKCERTKSGALRGYVHRCPQNYVYWAISRRCEREEVVRDCKRTINNWNGRWEIPINRQNVAW